MGGGGEGRAKKGGKLEPSVGEGTLRRASTDTSREIGCGWTEEDRERDRAS